MLVASLAGAAAADLKMPVKALPVVDPPFTWAGFYLGGNVGYSWGRGRTDLTETRTNTGVFTDLIGGLGGTPGTLNGVTTTTTTQAIGSARANINGFLGGVQIGNNWQIDRWVFGLEGDIHGTGQRGVVSLCLTAGCVS